MPLDPQARALLDRLAAANLPAVETLTIPEARQRIQALRLLASPPAPLARVEDRQLPGDLPARIYTPEGAGPFPVLVYFHGGGWVVGDLDFVDSPCRQLARSARCVVVSVAYRLAPEHKFPAPAEDCYAAVCHVTRNAASLNADPRRVAVGGDSAGGNLAAAVTLMARDRAGSSLAFQLLINPVTDCGLDTPSYLACAEGYLLRRNSMRWYWDQYLARPEDGRHPYASPLRAPDLTGLPPAHVMTAEFDPLRDEGEAYAARLREAGVRAQVRRYDGMIHGFFLMGGILDQGRQAVEDAAAVLRAELGR